MLNLRVAFDIGGVISKYPDIMCRMIAALVIGGAEVHIVTDMHDHAEVMRQLAMNGLDAIAPERVHCADYNAHGEGCKAELLAALGIDVFLDDFIGYVSAGGCPVRLLVMPDASKPYYADDWRIDSEPGFGRRVYRRVP